MHLELADDSATVASHIVGNTGQNGVETAETFTVIIDVRVFLVEREVAVFVFYNADFMTALLGFFNEAFGGIIGIAV